MKKNERRGGGREEGEGVSSPFSCEGKDVDPGHDNVDVYSVDIIILTQDQERNIQQIQTSTVAYPSTLF